MTMPRLKSNQITLHQAQHYTPPKKAVRLPETKCVYVHQNTAGNGKSPPKPVRLVRQTHHTLLPAPKNQQELTRISKQPPPPSQNQNGALKRVFQREEEHKAQTSLFPALCKGSPRHSKRESTKNGLIPCIGRPDRTKSALRACSGWHRQSPPG